MTQTAQNIRKAEAIQANIGLIRESADRLYVNRLGGNFTMNSMRPFADLVDDSASLTPGNLQQFLRGKETRFMRERILFAKRYTPGSNAWYAASSLRAAFVEPALGNGRSEGASELSAHHAEGSERLQSGILVEAGRYSAAETAGDRGGNESIAIVEAANVLIQFWDEQRPTADKTDNRLP